MTDTGRLLGEAIRLDPGDDTAWLALADHLEEQGQPARAELTRLSVWLRRLLDAPDHPTWVARLRELMALGVLCSSPTVTLSVGMRLVLIPPGSFLMGSQEEEDQRSLDEGPVHPVLLAEGFYLGVYPVTQEEWQAVMADNPSNFKGPHRPVESVSWGECVEFCTRLSNREGLHFRLPTEAEWEYACRAGTTTAYHFGNTITTDLANYDGTHGYAHAPRGVYRRQTTEVGEFPPNAFGLYDMHGNVWEWCSDWSGSGPQPPQPDAFGVDGGDPRMIRGGSWYVHPRRCRSAYRDSAGLDFRRDDCGCRVVLCRE